MYVFTIAQCDAHKILHVCVVAKGLSASTTPSDAHQILIAKYLTASITLSDDYCLTVCLVQLLPYLDLVMCVVCFCDV